MLNTRAILGFLGKFIGWFVLLMYVPVMFPALGIDRLYAGILIAEGNFFVGDSFGSQASVRFKPQADDPLGRDVRIEYTTTNGSAVNRGKTRTTGYWPTAYLMSLILASPLPWKRRGLALFAGFLLCQVFVCFRLFILSLYPCCDPTTPVHVFDVSDFTLDVLGKMNWIFVRSFAGSFVLPLIIWFPLCFRISDWKEVAAATHPAEAS